MKREEILVKISLDEILEKSNEAIKILEELTWLSCTCCYLDFISGKVVFEIEGMDENYEVRLKFTFVNNVDEEFLAKSIVHQLLIRNENTVKVIKEGR